VLLRARDRDEGIDLIGKVVGISHLVLICHADSLVVQATPRCANNGPREDMQG
jgi:hypothetical protein